MLKMNSTNSKQQLLKVINLCDSDDDDTSSSSKSSEESTDEEFLLLCTSREKRNCIRNYLEEIVPKYTETEFKKHFRIGKELFQMLSDKYKKSEDYMKIAEQYNVKSAEKHISVFLWFAGHEACSYRDLADRFDLSLWTVHHIICRVSLYISNLAGTVICWPDESQQNCTADYYLHNKRFPGIIGCIDGTHIQIDRPKKTPDDYIDRKGVVSICLQGICNEKKKLIDVFIGWPGSAHDSRIFKNSEVYVKLNDVREGYYLLGDSAYPCLKHLMVPYRDNGHLTRSQKQFNKTLSSCRVDIEHCFGILKQRFRQLYYCKLRNIKILCHFIRACCILHNLSDSEEDRDIFDFETILDNFNVATEQVGTEDGKSLRDDICKQLFP